MKKFISLLLTASIGLSCFSTTAFAANDITVKVNGTSLAFDVPPQTINGRTMVPMRVIFEKLGANVTFTSANNSDNGKAYIYAEEPISQMAIGMYIDDPHLYLYNASTNNISETITLDTAPTVIDGRTLVPVRAIAKAFNCNVTWIDSTKTVSILTDSSATTSPKEDTVSTIFPIKSISLDKKEQKMVAGESFKLIPSIEPANLSDKVSLTWTSSNQKVATISNDGTVTALSPGRTTISVKTADNKSTSCKVTVKNVVPLEKNREYGPMKVVDSYTSYDGFDTVLDSNKIESFVFTNIEKSYESYKLTACIQGKVTGSDYVNVEIYFYNSSDQCIGTAHFLTSVQEGTNYNISDYTYVDDTIIENAQYIKFFSSSGNEAKLTK